MLAVAALVPETVLLIPGAAGRETVLADVRAAALDAVTELVATGPERVVVVAPVRAGSAVLTGHALVPSLAAAGIPDGVLGWEPTATAGPGGTAGPRGTAGVPVAVRDVGASVGLLLLAQAGWTAEVALALVPADDPVDLRRLGAELAGGTAPVGLLLMGSLSARRGPDGPLPDDDRAEAFDEAVADDLTALGHAGADQAADRLAGVPRGLAAELGVSAWAPWQVLLGALALDGQPGLPGRRGFLGAPFGATYVVVGWGPGR